MDLRQAASTCEQLRTKLLQLRRPHSFEADTADTADTADDFEDKPARSARRADDDDEEEEEPR